jgi:hypothetical protein
MVLLKKNGKLKICVDFKKLIKTTKKIFILCHFLEKYEAYSFLDGYSGEHHISIAPEDRYKTTFVVDWGDFVWMVMPFGVKNGPPTFRRVFNRAFREYLD